LHSLFSGKDRDLKIQRQRVLYRGLTNDAYFRYLKFCAFLRKRYVLFFAFVKQCFGYSKAMLYGC
ncbi:hypothetical protein, partial [Bacteroides thetaiotaomicron]